MEPTQIPDRYANVINSQLEIFNLEHTLTDWNTIPETRRIPLDDPTHWLRIKDIICLYVDMKGSTQLSATVRAESTARAYQLFTGTAVRLFREFESSYIDVRGDGVFALFNYDEPYRAIACAVTFKTFCFYEIIPKIKERTGFEIGSHIGIDQKFVLVKKIGLRHVNGTTDRQNEVWAGKPVNMSSKLASLSNTGEILVSDRFFSNLKDEHILKSCGCPDGVKTDLWEEIDLSEQPIFDFNKCYKLTSNWCKIHGKEYCETILELDKK